ncbi:MAG: hypothetical protein V4667_03660 [Bacteroidota bacterium]
MNNIIFLFLVFLCSQAFAQDTIVFKSGAKAISKIEEINPETIKYRKLENIKGPLIIANRSDVLKIKYKNGTIDEIAFSPALNNEQIDTDTTLINKTNIVYIDLLSLGVKKLNLGYEKIIAKGYLGIGLNGYYVYDRSYIYQYVFDRYEDVIESHGFGIALKYYPKGQTKRKGFYFVLNSDYNTNKYKAYNLSAFNIVHEQYLNHNGGIGDNEDEPLLSTFYTYKKGATYKTAIGLGLYTLPVSNFYISVDGIIGFYKNNLSNYKSIPSIYGLDKKYDATTTNVYLRASLKIGYRFGCNKKQAK